MKIGLDVHGVIDQHLGFWAIVTDLLVNNGHEVHIITGLTKKDYDQKALSTWIKFTHFHSITDNLHENGQVYKTDIHGRKYFDEYEWNTAKAKYCDAFGIEVMLDNSDIYGKYFSTPYFKIGRIK